MASTIMKIKMSTKVETRRQWGDWDKEKRNSRAEKQRVAFHREEPQ